MTKQRIYLSGPMSGLPDHNYPAFDAEAARLRAIGFHVENPADNAAQPNWQGYMRNAIAQLVSCDAVALLPGWKNSRGALIENGLAVSLGIPSRPCEEFQAPHPAPDCWVCEGSGTYADNECPFCMEPSV